jgi:RNA polymerase sigma factor (sigma-70 family)
MTDEQLMDAVKSGDLRQASLLFDRYNKRLFNYLMRMTFDRELAEDLTQNVFVRLLRYRTSYKEGLRFQSWIYQVARNVFADHYQENKKHRSSAMDTEDIGDQLPEPGEGPEQREQERLLVRSMAMLNDDQRELLVLTRFTNLKYEEVAVLMNTTVANIKVKVHRAIGQLRENYFALEKI